MLLPILLAHLLSVIPTCGDMLRKYDMAALCGRTVSMNDDNVYGLELLMNMTSQIAARGSCHLTLEKRSDLDYLHFYIADTDDFVDCVHMSLFVKEGDSKDSLLPCPDLATVCGLRATIILGEHYMTSRRYLILEVTWDYLAAAAFRGNVFRLVANSYTCDPNCAFGFHKCDEGPCIHSELTDHPVYDFCGRSLNCSGDLTSTSKDINWTITVTAVIILVAALFIAICACCLCILCYGAVATCRGSADKCDKCHACCKSCACHCAACCIRGGECCCEGAVLAKDRLAQCWDEVGRQMSSRENQTVVTAPPAMTPTYMYGAICTDNANIDSVPVDISSNSPNQHDLSGDEFSDYSEVSMPDHNRAPSDTCTPPPSYTTAMATPTAPSVQPPDTPTITPTDPPSYDTATVPPIEELPDYHVVMANRTFYNTRSTDTYNARVYNRPLETDL